MVAQKRNMTQGIKELYYLLLVVVKLVSSKILVFSTDYEEKGTIRNKKHLGDEKHRFRN